MPAIIIPFELPLPKTLPTIEGNVDYQTFRQQLIEIDHSNRSQILELERGTRELSNRMNEERQTRNGDDFRSRHDESGIKEGAFDPWK
jgi:hypothetical protein